MNRSFSKIRHIQESNEALERRRLDEANLTRLIKRSINEQPDPALSTAGIQSQLQDLKANRPPSAEEVDAYNKKLAAQDAAQQAQAKSFVAPTLPQVQIKMCGGNGVYNMTNQYRKGGITHIMPDSQGKNLVIFSSDKKYCRVTAEELKQIIS